jgi:hypothetical protein
MVQYLLETYALDDELSQSYMAVTTAKQAERKSEKSFGRCLHRLAIRAGNIIDKRDLTTIYVEGLPTFVQAGLRMHLKPGMSFETVQRLAHNLCVTLRHAVAQPQTKSVGTKTPFGVRTLIPSSGSVLVVESQESSSVGVQPSDLEEGSYPELEANMAAGQAAGGYVSNAPSLSRLGGRQRLSPLPLAQFLYARVAGLAREGWCSQKLHQQPKVGIPRAWVSLSHPCVSFVTLSDIS